MPARPPAAPSSRSAPPATQTMHRAVCARSARAMADQRQEPTEIELKVAVRLGTQRMLARFQEFFDIEADLFELYVQTNILAPRRAPSMNSDEREEGVLSTIVFLASLAFRSAQKL